MSDEIEVSEDAKEFDDIVDLIGAIGTDLIGKRIVAINYKVLQNQLIIGCENGKGVIVTIGNEGGGIGQIEFSVPETIASAIAEKKVVKSTVIN